MIVVAAVRLPKGRWPKAMKKIMSVNWESGRDLEETVTKSGMKRIGMGNYAKVYSLDSKRVLKLAMGDPCWDAIVRFFQRNSSKYIPKVYWHRRYEGNANTPRGFPADFFSATVMERLQKAPGRNWARYMHMEDYDTDMWNTINKLELSRKHPMYDILAKLKKLGEKMSPRCHLDLHEENVMFRQNGTPVLVDPSYFFRNLGSSV